MFSFIENRCIINLFSKECYEPVLIIYQNYVKYCSEQKQYAIADNVFGTQLKARGIEKIRISKNGNRQYCYQGVKLKDNLNNNLLFI